MNQTIIEWEIISYSVDRVSPIDKISASQNLCHNVPMVKFGWSENLLDLLMQGANSCNDGFIAEISNFLNLGIAFANRMDLIL